jgi:phosphoglycerate dehydrogenase-like enzyme
MTSKPTVAFVLPKGVYTEMFRPEDLAHLMQIANVVGPVEVKNLADAPPETWGATAVITGWGTPVFTSEALSRYADLKLISHSAGSIKGLVNDHVYDRGIRVINATSANAVPVAHFTVAMMVTLLKQVPWLSIAMAKNDQAEIDRRRPHIRELQDMTVGIIGASRIGRLVIEQLLAYPGVSIKLYDPHITRAQASALRVTLAPLDEVCACEVVSVHAPSLKETHKMLNAARLRLLPDHAVLINTSRGALIDEVALIAEVRRRPLYVALDVTDPEPPPLDSPLRKEPNIILTPHIAGAMNQARRHMGRLAIAETIRFLKGEKLQHEVTREMFPTQA